MDTKAIQGALIEALNELGGTNVRYGGNDMTINNVLAMLVREKLGNDFDYSTPPNCEGCEREDGTSCIHSCVCDLERWVCEPHEEDLLG